MVSVTSAPENRPPKLSAMMVTTGISALRRAWRHTTRAPRRALGARGADEVLAQGLDHRGAHVARVVRRC